MSVTNLFQFVIGFFLGIILFSAGIAGGGYFFLTRVSSNPPKPDFPQDKPEATKAEKPKPTPSATQAEKPKPEPKKEEPKTEELPPGAYRAKVTWSSGLSLRGEPSTSAERVGGVGYNASLIILANSDDGKWQKVRIPGTNQEGWVKAGNIRKVEESEQE